MISTYTTYDSKKIHTVTRKSNIYKDHLGQYVYEAKDMKKIRAHNMVLFLISNKKSNMLKIKIIIIDFKKYCIQ